MNRLMIYTVIITTCLCCSNFTKEHSSNDIEVDNITDSMLYEYSKILNGLNHDYVLCYRNVKETTENIKDWGMPENDSVFKQDSIIYWESYKNFFSQDIKFIHWLLTFKNDSTNAGLWSIYPNPLSSNISECNFRLKNSRAAIILIENLLNGEGFKCYECDFTDRQNCNTEKYSIIENFLKVNEGKNIAELRLLWKMKNAH